MILPYYQHMRVVQQILGTHRFDQGLGVQGHLRHPADGAAQRFASGAAEADLIERCGCLGLAGYK